MSFDGVKRTALERVTPGNEGARLVGAHLSGYSEESVQLLLEALLSRINARSLPAGGTTDQVLGKTSSSDYATSWRDGGISQAAGDARWTQIGNLGSLTDAAKGAALVGWRPPSGTGDGRTLSDRLLVVADPKDYGAYGGEKVTTGTVTAGDLSHITLTSVTGLTQGMDLMIETLGTAGGKHYSNISSISGSVATLATPVVSAGTGVTVTVYDSEAITRAHNYLQGKGGGVLLFDATHVIARTPPIIQSNIMVVGTPRGSLKHHANTPLGSLLDVINGGGGGLVGTNISFENVTFDGNRAGQSSWTAATNGVPGEYTMCVRIYDGEDITFRGCKFKNPVGDGITLTAPASGPVGCNRITIDDCRFVGTNDNRNGVSLVYCQNVSITNSYFYRMSRTTMPGAIDLEPDASHSVKDVYIAGNKISNPSGTVMAAGITLSSGAAGRLIEDVSIVENVIRGSSTTINQGILINGAAADMRNVEVAGNKIYGSLNIGVQAQGSSAPHIHHNQIYGPTRGIAWAGTADPHVEANEMVGCPAFGIRQDAAGTKGLIERNHIIDCGSSGISTSAGISIASTVARGTKIIGNHIDATDTTNYMRYGIHLVATCNYGNEIEGNYVNNANTFNLYIQTANFQRLGLNSLSDSTANSIGGTYPPTSGTWAAGTRIYALAPAAGAAPGWVCTTAGTPGTWTPLSIVASQATETVIGPAEIATQAETDTGTDDARFVTPLKLATRPQKNVVFENYIDGLNLVWASPGTNFNNITATPGAAWIPGSSKVLNFPSTLTPATGTPAATTWYHFYIYDNAGTPAIEVSTTAPVAYKGNSYQKTSDNTRRYIGSRKTDGSGKFYNFQKIGVTVRYLENQNQSPFTVLSNGTSTTEATVSCTAAVPVTARSVKVQLENTSSTQIAWFGSSIDSVTGGTAAGIGYVQTQKQYADFLALDSSQAFSYWFPAAPTNGLYAMILGFEEVR